MYCLGLVLVVEPEEVALGIIYYYIVSCLNCFDACSG
jgi:hypothetical protein